MAALVHHHVHAFPPRHPAVGHHVHAFPPRHPAVGHHAYAFPSHPPPQPPPPFVLVRWTPPRPGFWKLNTDGSVFHDGSKRASIGGAIRDCAGRVILAFAERTEHACIGEVEARALLRGLRLALDNGCTLTLASSRGPCLMRNPDRSNQEQQIGVRPRVGMQETKKSTQQGGWWSRTSRSN